MSRQARGFTLIELLVGLAIIAIVIGGLSSVLHAGLRIRREHDRYTRAHRIADGLLDEIEVSLRHLHRDRGGAIWASDTLQVPGWQLSWNADGVATLEAVTDRYLISAGSSVERLTSTSRSGIGAPTVVTYSPEITNVELRYADPAPPDALPSWEAGRASLPALVKVTVEVATAEDRHRWWRVLPILGYAGDTEAAKRRAP
jgi:prepilin-type N-terminal cleavage/methylation domain-containing protein